MSPAPRLRMPPADQVVFRGHPGVPQARGGFTCTSGRHTSPSAHRIGRHNGIHRARNFVNADVVSVTRRRNTVKMVSLVGGAGGNHRKHHHERQHHQYTKNRFHRFLLSGGPFSPAKLFEQDLFTHEPSSFPPRKTSGSHRFECFLTNAGFTAVTSKPGLKELKRAC